MKSIFNVFTLVIIISFIGCKDSTEETSNPNPPKPKEYPVKFDGLKNGAQFNAGREIPIVITAEVDKLKDSIKVYFNDDLLFSINKKEKIEYELSTTNLPLGAHNIKIIAPGNDGKNHGDNRQVVIFASSEPLKRYAKIVASYPHNRTYYTQGLEFDGNDLWEGTGNYGESLIAKVNLKTGEAIQNHKIEDNYFGEGITIIGDKIYQLTYKAGKCFVYDKNTLERINTFTYAGEGWGLTNNDSLLIMSNGSHKIYFINPETFETVREIQAFSNQRDFANLNELEWVKGYIYANIYTTNTIIKIDPKNGQVIETIDCSDIVKDASSPNTDVLNGIAYDTLNESFYVTGKLWSKLYKVSFDIAI